LLLPEGCVVPDRGYKLERDKFGNYNAAGLTEMPLASMDDLAAVRTPMILKLMNIHAHYPS
jgi:hypothetical protein